MSTTTLTSMRTEPHVLFVSDDPSSAQIAASLLRRLTRGTVQVTTAGTQPVEAGGRTDEMLVAMGLDPAEGRPLSAHALHLADRVVILGAGLDIARLPGPLYEEWDPAVGDLLERVQALSDDLTRPPAPAPRSLWDRLAALLRRTPTA